MDYGILKHEQSQGEHIPVYLGRLKLILPWNYDSGVYTHSLFLG